MGRDDVVPLAEGLHDDLPVRGDLLHGMELDAPLGEVEVREVLDQLGGVGVERLGAEVEVDEHPARPAGDLGFGQRCAVRGVDHLREVPLAWQLGELALERPAPAVEGATEAGHPAIVDTELRAPVQAGVVVSPDRAVGGAGHDQRLVGDVVDDVVAGLRDLILVTGHLPRAGPEVRGLERGELRGRVPALRHVRLTLEDVGLVLQRDRDLAGVVGEHLLEARTGATRLARAVLGAGHRGLLVAASADTLGTAGPARPARAGVRESGGGTGTG